MTDPFRPDTQTTALLAAGLAPRRDPGRWQPPGVEELQGVFPNLEIISLLGVGGMGAVYKARQTNLDRLVALKLLAGSHAHEPGFDERFAREARTLARLDHPAIVAIHDFGTVADRPYLVMQLIDGSNLRQVMATGALSGAEVLRLIPQLCSALAHAHGAGVVHRDLKPENILIDGRGNVHIADFGLAKLNQSGSDLTGTGDVLGTAHYMAPEQLVAASQVDHRADLYALGVIIYEMLTGGLPRGRFEPPSHSSAVSAAMDDVVMRTLERDPARRFGTATELNDAVSHASAGAAAAAAEAAPASKAPGTTATPAAKTGVDATRAAGAGAAAAAAAPASGPSIEPGSGTRTDSVQFGLGGIHIKDGEDEVRIGLDGIHVSSKDGSRVDIGSARRKAHDFKEFKDFKQFDGGGHGPFFRAGMLAVLGGAAFGMGLMLSRLGGFVQDHNLHFAQHRDGDIAMLVTPLVIAGGIALLSRCCLPMVLLGVIAEIAYIPWLWTEHWMLFWFVFLAPVLWQMHVVFNFHELRDHMGSLLLRDRLLRLIWVTPIMGLALLLPLLPWMKNLHIMVNAG